jgi:hypothetical protein
VNAAKKTTTYRLSFERSVIRVDRPRKEWAECEAIGHDLHDPEGRTVRIELGPGVRLERFTRDELRPLAEELAAAWKNSKPIRPVMAKIYGLAFNVDPSLVSNRLDEGPAFVTMHCVVRCTLEGGPMPKHESPESTSGRAIRAALAAVGAG